MNVNHPKGKIIPRSRLRSTRKFTQAYKLRILEKGSHCKNITELNNLMKREGLHSAQLIKWWREFSNRLTLNHAFLKPTVENQTIEASFTNNPALHNNLSASLEPKIDLHEILAKVWRRKWLLLTTLLLSMLLAVIFIQSVTPIYTSRALIMIGKSDDNLIFERGVPSLQVNNGTMQNALEVLRSFSIAEKVVEKLNLDQYPEFNPELQEKNKLATFFRKIRPLEKTLDNNLPVSAEADDFSRHENIPIIESFLEKQKLTLIGESRVIELNFSSYDPRLAAKIANTTLDLYLSGQIETKFSVTNKTSDRLNNQIADLRQKVKDAEIAIGEYRNTSGLLQTAEGLTLNSQQLSAINTQLILAGTNRTEKEARLKQAQKFAGGSVKPADEVMDSEHIRNLREQETILKTNLTDLSISYGPKHPRIVNLLAEKNEVQGQISTEIKKIITNLQNEANMSRLRERKIKSRLKELEAKLSGSKEQEAQLKILEREAEANRKQLSNLLSRFKETNEQTFLELQQAAAKVISYATPLKEPSFPRKVPILTLTFFGSTLFGLLMIFLCELFDKGFRSSVQIEKDTGLPSLGLVPKLGRFRSRIQKPESYVRKFPASPLSEAIRSAYTSIIFGNKNGHPAKVIQFTSAYPGEGKSTIARCLAILKRQGGMRSIIIDADMRNPSIHTSFNVRPQPGLAEYLSGDAAVYQVITQDKKSGVYLVTAGRAKKSPTDLLPSKKLEQLISDLSEVFDLIIIDSPPVLAVPDARLLSNKVDMTAFVVKWADTRKEVVLYALKQLYNSGAPQLGTILTMVDAKKHAQYSFADSGLYMGKLSNYYVAD